MGSRFYKSNSTLLSSLENVSHSITITGSSTALFSTWFLVEPFGVLFDCGEGVTSTLLQKSRKVKKVFVTHSDRDHVAGLLQFNQLNGREGLQVYYPRDCGSFPALADFTSKFDPHTVVTEWLPLEPAEEVDVSNGISVVTVENEHVPKKDERLVKSLSFTIQQKKKKLKAEYSGLAGPKIGGLRKTLGDDQLFDEVTEKLLTYSGDTPVAKDGRYNGSKILIHESTFLTKDEIGGAESGRNLHSSLDEVMEMVAEAKIENLILTHFSSRYSDEEINEAVEREKLRCGVGVPIQIVFPRQLFRAEI